MPAENIIQTAFTNAARLLTPEEIANMPAEVEARRLTATEVGKTIIVPCLDPDCKQDACREGGIIESIEHLANITFIKVEGDGGVIPLDLTEKVTIIGKPS
jgi:hypothetical protein